MDGFAGLGALGGVFVVFWAIASILIPFFIWGIHSKAHQAAKDISEIKLMIAHSVGPSAGDAVQDDSLIRDM
ncbi:hypothetical protein N9913_02475 [Porticoccaceae bacterium]|nr:hypothetical protein [Porticoccaceae bacterium]